MQKHLILSWILMTMCVVSTMGESHFRSEEEAKLEAQNFLSRLSQKQGRRLTPATLQLAYTYTDTLVSHPSAYIFNTHDGGFVLVASQRQDRPILGYSLDAKCDSAHIPAQLLAVLHLYTKSSSQYSIRPNNRRQASATTQSYTPIQPLLGDRMWGQSVPFNDFCPLKDGIRTVSGCVATAAAQLMCVHEWPKRGKNTHSYVWNDEQLTVDYALATYDWEHMRPNCNDVYNQSERDAIAQLVYHVGVACDMNYGTSSEGGSGSSFASVMQGLHTYFDYDADVRTLMPEFMSEQVFLDSVHKELAAGRPCYVSARTQTNSGHAFLCDGMDDKGFVHINWGWNGSMNGYYAIHAMAPTEQGIGGSGTESAYSEDIRFYIGIQPNQGGIGHPLMTCQERRLYPLNRLSKQDTTVLTHSVLKNDGVWDFKGQYVFLIYSETQKLVQVIPAFDEYVETLSGGYYYEKLPFYLSAKDITLPNGNYYLTTGIQTDDETKAFLFPEGVNSMISMMVTSDSVFLNHELDAGEIPAIEYNFAYCSATRFNSDKSPYLWRLQLETDNFFSTPANLDANGLLMLLIQSPEDDSFLGTYYYNGPYSEEAYDLNYISLYRGCYSNYSQVEGGNGAVAIQYEEGNYSFEYYLNIGGDWVYGTFVLPAADVSAYSDEDKTTITLKEKGGSQDNEYQPEHLKVKVVADTAYFSWDVKQMGDHFCAAVYADDDLVYNQCINSTSFALYSPKRVTYTWIVYNMTSDNKSLGYEQQQVTPTCYTPFNMQVETLNDTTYYFHWQVRDTASIYQLSVQNEDEGTYPVVEDGSMSYLMKIYAAGNYQWTVTAYYSQSSYYSTVGEADGPRFTIEDTEGRAWIDNLSAEINQQDVNVSWIGNAPSYYVYVFYGNERLAGTLVTQCNYAFQANSYGTYSIFVRPMDNYFYLAPYWYQVDATMSPSTNTNVNHPSPNSPYKVIYQGQLYILRDCMMYNAQGTKL